MKSDYASLGTSASTNNALITDTPVTEPWTTAWMAQGAKNLQPPVVTWNHADQCGQVDLEGRDTCFATDKPLWPPYWHGYSKKSLPEIPGGSASERKTALKKVTQTNIASLIEVLEAYSWQGVPTDLTTLKDAKATHGESNVRVLEVLVLRVLAERYRTPTGMESEFVFQVCTNDGVGEPAHRADDWKAYARGPEQGGMITSSTGNRRYQPTIMWKEYSRSSQEGQDLLARRAP